MNKWLRLKAIHLSNNKKKYKVSHNHKRKIITPKNRPILNPYYILPHNITETIHTTNFPFKDSIIHNYPGYRGNPIFNTSFVISQEEIDKEREIRYNNLISKHSYLFLKT